MKKVGLVAGGGIIPLEFIKAVKARGDRIVVFALEGMASGEIEALADKTYRVEVGKFLKYLFPLVWERMRKIAFLGKVEKNIIYDDRTYDSFSRKMSKGIKDRKDTTILEAITKVLKIIGVEVMDTREYLSHLMPDKGVIGGLIPDKATAEDMEFGFRAAKKMSEMDIGQTVIVKGRTVVAVEAMEGTDAAIERGRKVAGEGCVMVKVSRPDQDYRWDVPAVGAETVRKLAENGYKGLAVESKRMYLVEKEEMVKLADEKGIAIVAV